jgi:WD40 repeat protein
VLAIHYDRERDLLFSGGADGTVKIWEPESGTLLYSLLISHLPVSRFAVHPTRPLIAALEASGPGSATIKVWNWESKVRLYSIELNDFPLFFDFSPKGTYLFSCQADWTSISFYNAASGVALPLLDNGFGIVSFATISQSERNIMTYQPSGKITYWEIRTGREIKAVETLPNLSLAKISHNKRFLVAQIENRLAVVDLLSGRLISRVDQADIQSMVLSQDDRILQCLIDDGEKSTVAQWLLTGDQLYRLNSPGVEQPIVSENITAITMRNEDLVFGDSEGILWIRDANGNVRKLSQNNLLEVSDFAVRDDKVALATPEAIISFRLDVSHYSSRPDDIITSYSYRRHPNPYDSPVGLKFQDEDNLLIWDKSEENRGMGIIRLSSGYLYNEYGNFSSPQMQIELSGQRILSLESNGLFRVLELSSYNPLFEYHAPGIQKIISAGEHDLIGAGSQLGGISGSLIRIDSRTGETVPLSDSSVLTYDLVYDDNDRILYTLSIDRKSGTTQTCVKSHYGKDLEKSRSILSYKGEDLLASLEYDAASKILFTSLGHDRVQSWDGEDIETYQATRHIPRTLRATNRLLFALNKDSTLTVWDRQSRKVILDLYLFKDYSWIAVFPNENAYISEKADHFLILPTRRKKLS